MFEASLVLPAACPVFETVNFPQIPAQNASGSDFDPWYPLGGLFWCSSRCKSGKAPRKVWGRESPDLLSGWRNPKGHCAGWGGSWTHGCRDPGTHQNPPVLQESEDDDEEEEEEEDDDEDEDDDDDNGDSSEEGGDSSESSSEEESEDGDEVRPCHGEGTWRARGPPSPSSGLGGTHGQAQIDPWQRSPQGAGGHGEEKGSRFPPGVPGKGTRSSRGAQSGAASGR